MASTHVKGSELATRPNGMLFSGKVSWTSLAEFITWFKTKVKGWELTMKDRLLTSRDWACIVAHNFCARGLEWWKDHIASILEET